MVEQAKLYMIIRNERGELCVFLTPPVPYGTGPDAPEIVYDGGENALLYRGPRDAVILDYVDEKMRAPLAEASGVLVLEYDPSALVITREYMAQVKAVKKLPPVKGSMVSKEELEERLEMAMKKREGGE